jgi:hypothetical protein
MAANAHPIPANNQNNANAVTVHQWISILFSSKQIKATREVGEQPGNQQNPIANLAGCRSQGG